MPYRDDRSALESRRADLRREIDALRSRAEALRDVVVAQEAAERELAATEARLAEADARRASLLEDVRVASPCKASWEAMTGDDHVRFCGACEKNVYNLSAMTRDEATRLLAERDDRICVRLYRREDGTVLTADCPVGLRRKRVRLALYGVAFAGAVGSAAMLSMMTLVQGDMARPPRRGETMTGIDELADSYVPQPLHTEPQRGLVFVYRREAQPDRPAQEWKLWADLHGVHVFAGEGSSARPVVLPPVEQAAAEEIVAFARALRAEGAGVVPGFGDSALSRSYELFGTGSRAATDADRARLFTLAARLQLTSGEDRQ
jgi:hypothetical protein